ncbi:transposase [Pirellulaceae bacterium SH467]
MNCGVSMGVSSEPIDVLLVVEKRGPDEPTDHALGRSRGGYSTKVHLLVDGIGNPLAFTITGGQAHETTALLDVLDKADKDLHDSEGNPVAWPLNLAGDKGYRAEWIDKTLIELGINPIIPSKSYEDRDARMAQFDGD